MSWAANQKLLRARFPDQETKLHEKFCERRDEGWKCGGRWLKAKMKYFLRKDKLNGYENFKASDHWFTNFKRRYEISFRAASNKKSKSTEERLPQVRNFHRTAKAFRTPPPQADPKYGRFPASATYHMDQVPLEFGGMFNKTYAKKGSKRVRIRGTRYNLEKRQATLQLCFGAETQDVNPGLIFRLTPFTDKRGKVHSKKPLTKPIQKEFDKLKRKYPNVNLYAQKKAWADTNVSLDWLDDFRKEASKEEKLLGMDNLGAQCDPKFKAFAREKANSLLLYTPEDCTDICAVTDHGLGKMVKDKVKGRFDEDFEEDPDKWVDQGGLSAADRRELYVKWLSESWKEVQAERQPQITKAFQRCGMLNAVDGSEDHLIKVEGYDGAYNMHDDDPDEGGESERSVMSSSDDPESDNTSSSDDDMENE